MLQGEFIRGDGLRIPNNITRYGAEKILHAALRNTAIQFWVGLANAVPTPDLDLFDIIEPAATNGYGRIQISRSAAGWVNSADFNGEPYLESAPLVWTAVNGNFSAAVQRLVLCDAQVAGRVLALSSSMNEELLVTPITPLDQRTFRYRLHLR